MDINKKIDNLLKLSDNERYNYFIRKVVDNEKIWGLCKNGWALLGNDLGDNKVFPFWSEKELAELYAIDEWSEYEATSIDLYNFLDKWIPGMEKDNILISIFYTNQSKGKIVSPQDLQSDLNEELENYY